MHSPDPRQQPTTHIVVSSGSAALSENRTFLRQPRIPATARAGWAEPQPWGHSACSGCGRGRTRGSDQLAPGAPWSGPGRRRTSTQRVQVGLANLWQTAVGGSRSRDRSGTGPGLSCWFGVEPPAGIEPATPSLPSMVGPFGGQRGTSLRSIELQVAGLIDDREMGCCEAVCGVAAGKSLARMQIIEGLAGR
jgi:hypothetical protein